MKTFLFGIFLACLVALYLLSIKPSAASRHVVSETPNRGEFVEIKFVNYGGTTSAEDPIRIAANLSLIDTFFVFRRNFFAENKQYTTCWVVSGAAYSPFLKEGVKDGIELRKAVLVQ